LGLDGYRLVTTEDPDERLLLEAMTDAAVGIQDDLLRKQALYIRSFDFDKSDYRKVWEPLRKPDEKPQLYVPEDRRRKR